MTSIELTRCDINRYAAKKLSDELFEIEFSSELLEDSDRNFKNFFKKYEELINEISIYMKYDVMVEISENSSCKDLEIHEGFCKEFIHEIEEHLNSQNFLFDSKLLGIILLIAKAFMNNISDEKQYESFATKEFLKYMNLHI